MKERSTKRAASSEAAGEPSGPQTFINPSAAVANAPGGYIALVAQKIVSLSCSPLVKHLRSTTRTVVPRAGIPPGSAKDPVIVVDLVTNVAPSSTSPIVSAGINPSQAPRSTSSSAALAQRAQFVPLASFPFPLGLQETLGADALRHLPSTSDHDFFSKYSIVERVKIFSSHLHQAALLGGALLEDLCTLGERELRGREALNTAGDKAKCAAKEIKKL